MKSIPINPELNLGLSFASASSFKPSLNTKLPISWKVVMGILAILLLLYWTGNLESKDTPKKD